MSPYSQRRSSRSAVRLSIEPLEDRILLHSEGIAVANDAYWTLSFANDGVQVADQSSALYSKFNTIATEEVWKDAIVRAFQTWAVNTNADIGVRSDGGQAFGTPGAAFGDDRFGDIRIGAIAMDDSIGAVSVPADGVVGGTWLGDVLFNTNFVFNSIDDIFAIALHEAGNVFGLEDNNDPNSPLHTGTIPTATVPTATDILNLQSIYGVRAEDANESSGDDPAINNNSFINATEIEVNDDEINDIDGAFPSLVYGDITTLGDVDYFQIESPDDYTGPITFEVRSSGISLLTPRLQVFDTAQNLLSEEISTSSLGDRLTITLPSSTSDSDYYLVVDVAPAGEFGVGGYSLTVTFDGLIDPAELTALESYANGSLRKLSSEQISKIIAPDDDDFYDDDLGSDDTLLTARAIAEDVDFAAGGRFERTGSITLPLDRDFYTVQSPSAFTGPPGVLTVAVRSLSAGELIPRVTVFDEDGVTIPVDVILNGGGEVIVQAIGVEPGKEYAIEVEADDPGGPFSTGNYQLTASFQDTPAGLESFAAGTLAAGAIGNVHTFYVAQPQLFHFALGVSAGGGELGVLIATVRDAQGNQVYQLASPLGETRSQEAILLAPGEYTVEINAISLYVAITTSLDYDLRGTAISDPFAADPDDPNAHPFACTDPELAGFFCYPGNPEIISADPFLWDDFIGAQIDPPDAIDLDQLVSFLLGDWWSWVWEQIGINGPTLAQDDRFDVTNPAGTAAANAFATVTAGFNVLSNDIDPEGGPIVAVLTGGPSNGTLSLDPDGTASYTPNPGFTGTDSFTYTAYDFLQQSNSATARIVVSSGVTGDYDGNGSVSAIDHAAWVNSFGSTSELLADGNKNGVVDAADFTVWRDAFSQIVTIAGDYDRNGLVEQQDHAVWVSNFGSTTILSADGNNNGIIDAADYTVWRDAFSQVVTTITGDYDGNGLVDQMDHAAWVANFGSTTNLSADGNNNGVVDAADYAIWRDAFSIAASAATQSNPPPVALIVADPVVTDPVLAKPLPTKSFQTASVQTTQSATEVSPKGRELLALAPIHRERVTSPRPHFITQQPLHDRALLLLLADQEPLSNASTHEAPQLLPEGIKTSSRDLAIESFNRSFAQDSQLAVPRTKVLHRWFL